MNKVSIFTIITLSVLVLILSGVIYLKSSKILGTEVVVTIQSQVQNESIKYKIYPEKRIPIINNWSNNYSIIVENCTNYEQYNIGFSETNQYGNGNTSFANSDPNASYRFIIKGTSHLRFVSNCYTIDNVEETIDFTNEIDALKAGEISTVNDNYINSLDLSYLIINLGTSDVKSDLNRDGNVNALDLSIIIKNLFVAGE